ncbi:MAG: hypothetical protein WBM48_06715, partial [Polyangiales bacterium]
MNWRYALMLLLVCTASACNKSRTGRGPEIGGADRGCFVYKAKDSEFKYVTQQAQVDSVWHEAWTSRHGRTLPPPLTPPDVW